MENGMLKLANTIELNDNVPGKKPDHDAVCYDIMHGEKRVAEISMRGEVDRYLLGKKE